MKNYSEYTPQQIEGKRVLITGGTTGIGRATAVLLAQMKAKVFVCGRHRQELDDTFADAAEANTPIQGLVADVSTEQGIQKLFEAADASLGGLDILINNAAVAYQSILDGNFEDWQYVVNTNLLAYLACAREAVDRMKESGGHIVNVGSMSAEVREKGSSVYVATKSGIEGFSAALRKEVSDMNIKISLIEPGATATNMQGDDAPTLTKKTEDLEMLTADDVAVSIAYTLCQPKRCNVVLLQLRPHKQEI
ncbi:MAG: SDR family oxidoreductase [Flavobacterium sp.]|uniref:SDR family oxidoreductase n=1 Tax=Flavobacterium sp. TaxID=239 RepID=UPI0012043E64|nr:SDR family oxidoreductase [Flavobacterium sp.]RZJ66304.1 MAG: SDR family oxidoreductase [Flavobacterium sp.]